MFISRPLTCLVVCIASVGLAFGSLNLAIVQADESATIDVTVNTTDAGSFSVTIQVIDESNSFGSVGLNAQFDAATSQTFVLTYADSSTQRGGGDVTISMTSFEPSAPIPSFTGSDQAQFQIPNRYLTLTNIGEVIAGEVPPACTPPLGTITADAGHESSTFDNGASLNVSNVESGCGVGTATQEISIDLTVPAGVYPTTYMTTMTIETTVS